MKIIEEVSIEYNEGQHRRNIDDIINVINILLNSNYKECASWIRNTVITNDISSTKKRYNYTELKEKFYACMYKVDEVYDVIVNYGALSFKEDDSLPADIMNYLCHEFQHIADHNIYDKLVEEYRIKKGIKDNNVFERLSFFYEFNASYKAQLFCPLKWEHIGYSLDTIDMQYSYKLMKIKSMISELPKYDYDAAKQSIININSNAYDFSRKLMYDLAIICGSNVADNQRESNKKYISIQISGIENELDDLLNKFIEEVNSVIDDDKKIIEYIFENGYLPFNYISNLIIEKIRN